MTTIAKLPFSETHERSGCGEFYVMKEKFAIPYRESVKEQLEAWVKGNPKHNDFANECCPDFSCCHPSMLWSLEKRELFARTIPEIRESMLTDALVALTYSDEVKLHVSGTKVPPETQH